MTLYILLFKGGHLTSDLTSEYLDRFANWAKTVGSKKIPGQRFKQEGKVVSSKSVNDLQFTGETVGGYIVIETENYGSAIKIAKGCPILENNGSIEIREIIFPKPT